MTHSKKTSTVTSKGQVTIPKEVRTHLHVHAGDRVEFRIGGEGEVHLLPLTRPVRDLYGILERPGVEPVSQEEADRTIAETVAERDLRTRRR